MPPRTSPENYEHVGRLSLEAQLRQDEDSLRLLVESTGALTADRVRASVENADELLRAAIAEGIGWPDEDSAVPLPEGAFTEKLKQLSPDEADMLFASTALGGTAAYEGRGFNNFVIVIGSRPAVPEQGESFNEFFMRLSAGALYGSKPYLWRAHMLQPELMRALQQEIGLEKGSISRWESALERGASKPEVFPRDAALLRSSRLSYMLLSQLMRQDDLALQMDWLGMSREGASMITDPEVELWT